MDFSSILLTLKSGFPYFLSHFLLTLAILCLGIVIYNLVTRHDEVSLIKEGNVASAISFSGAWIGIAMPLAFCMASSYGFYDIIIWGGVAVLVQILAFIVLDKFLKNLSARIEKGEVASAILVFAVKISIAIINSAAISG
jgi:putative membrane protein